MTSYERMLLVLVAGALTVVSGNQSHAGDPGLSVEYTNMTPNELSDEASKQCSNTIKEQLRRAIGPVVHVGETERRQRLGAADRSSDFMSWGRSQIVLDDFTFVVAVDCRPSAQQLDVLLVGRKASVTFRLRDQPLGTQRLIWLADDISLRAEAMYWR
jgi:hypothetical protein